jgi:transglutaminase-like putative cysteine protease
VFDVSITFCRSVFVLATLSAVMLATAEGELFPNILTVPLAGLAYFLTVRRERWVLPNLGANILALIALLFAGGEWLQGEMTSDQEAVMLERLVAGTHLLVYLMWIVLFQQKTTKHYWWMFALSLLQVAVGAVLTESGTYGFLLVVYLFTAIWTLSLFTLQLARQEMKRPADTAAASLSVAGLAVVKPHGADPGVRSILQPSRVVWENNARGWSQHRVDLRFVVGACGTAFASIGVAMLFFMLVPRFWIGQLPSVRNGARDSLVTRMTGFSDEVELGSMGQILESNERVLFLRIFNADGDELDVARYARNLGHDEPLFRGAVLGVYENGRWVAGRMGAERHISKRVTSRNQLVRQEFRITLTNTKYLFAMHPIRGCRVRGEDHWASYKRFSAMLRRDEQESNPAVVEYTIHSPPSVATTGHPVLPLFKNLDGTLGRPSKQMLAQCRHFPNENGRLSRLQTLAQRIAGYDPESDEQPSQREMARRLEAHLRDSGDYGYSLDSSIVNANDDPVEDFLFNRKQGHCEYYATALALMLRAVDIPSRLVNGFKGGGVNRLTGEFYVEQRHAHAWVEALIDGGWVTLDATPAAARSESVAGLAPAILSWNDLLNTLKEQWSASFVSMDVDKQQRQFYGPIKNTLAATWDSLKGDGDALGGDRGSLREFLASPKNWFSWQGGLATAVILSTMLLAVWLVRKLWTSRGTTQSSGRRNRTVEQVRVEFYERFRRLCSALGLVRSESETEREFLVALNGEFQAELSAAGLERVPGDLVDSFYAVRFGGRRIDVELQQRVDSQLSALERLATTSPRKA